MNEIKVVSFEFIPERFVGEYPYAVIRIKKSQLSPYVESYLREQIGNIFVDAMLKERER